MLGSQLLRQSKDAPEVAKRIQEEFQSVKVRVCPSSDPLLYADFLNFFLTQQAYQCDVCDLDKLHETFQRIQSELGDISGVIAVRFILLNGFLFADLHPRTPASRWSSPPWTCRMMISTRSSASTYLACLTHAALLPSSSSLPVLFRSVTWTRFL